MYELRKPGITKHKVRRHIESSGWKDDGVFYQKGKLLICDLKSVKGTALYLPFVLSQYNLCIRHHEYT